MAVVGSAAWCDAEQALGAQLPERPGSDARLSFSATGGPEGEVQWHLHMVGGRFEAVAPGADDDADAVVTLPLRDAEAIGAGELDANAAFMQGRLKASGATGPLLRWLAVESARKR